MESRAHTAGEVRLTLPPATVLRALSAVIAFLVLASLAGQVSRLFFRHDHVFGLVPLFDLDKEANIPTWYQAATLLACAVLLGLIGGATRATGRPFARHWFGLSLIFAYLSIDEAAFVHELLNPVFRSWWHLPAFLYLSWVVAGVALVAILLAAYARFLLALPRRDMWRFVASGAIYVGGAIGMEMVGSWIAVEWGGDTFSYAMAATIEETLEMTGIALFIYSLLTYLGETFGGVRVAAPSSRPPEGPLRYDEDQA